MTESSRDRGTPPDVTTFRAIHLAVCFGLFTGIGSAALIGIQKFVLDRITLSSPHIAWTAPLILVVLAIPIGALFSLAVRALPRRHRMRTLIFALALGACGTGLMVWGKQLADFSVIVLSLGVAAQLSYLAAHRWALFQRMLRFATIAGVATTLVAAGMLGIGRPLRERFRVASLPAAPAGAPNVLIVILDTVRALNLSLHGYARPTSPNLERIAQSGTTFDRAFAPAPWTLPSHASMFTGVAAHELSADWKERFDASAPTLAEYFRDRGYRTGGIVGNWFYCNSEWGIDRGFLHYSDYTNSLGHALAATSIGNKLVKSLADRWKTRFWFHRIDGRRIAPDVTRDLLRWIDRAGDRPFFAFVNYYDAHDPYVAPDPYVERLGGLPRPVRLPMKVIDAGVSSDADPDHRAGWLKQVDMYDAAIAYLDDHIGRLFDQLEERGLLENTIVVITSDHGEEFGENGHYWHGNSLNNPAIHVPLIIRYPRGVPFGVRVDSATSLADIPATVTALAGLETAHPFPGASLARYWDGSDAGTDRVLTSVRLQSPRAHSKEAELRAVITNDLHYIVSDRGIESLFRYRSDPLEQNDLAQTDSLASRAIPQLRNTLEAGEPWIKQPVPVTAAGRPLK